MPLDGQAGAHRRRGATLYNARMNRLPIALLLALACSVPTTPAMAGVPTTAPAEAPAVDPSVAPPTPPADAAQVATPTPAPTASPAVTPADATAQPQSGATAQAPA